MEPQSNFPDFLGTIFCHDDSDRYYLGLEGDFQGSHMNSYELLVAVLSLELFIVVITRGSIILPSGHLVSRVDCRRAC